MNNAKIVTINVDCHPGQTIKDVFDKLAKQGIPTDSIVGMQKCLTSWQITYKPRIVNERILSLAELAKESDIDIRDLQSEPHTELQLRNRVLEEVAKRSCILPHITVDAVDDHNDSRVLQVTYASAISGGQDEQDSMPKQISLVRLIVNCDKSITELRTNYVIEQ